MTSNVDQLVYLRYQIYLDTLYTNSQNGKILWTQRAPFVYTALEQTPATTIYTTSGPVSIPRRVWQFFMVRNLVNGNPQIMLDVQRNGTHYYSFNSNDFTQIQDLFDVVVSNATFLTDNLVDSTRALDLMIPLLPPAPGHPYIYKAHSSSAGSSSISMTANVIHSATSNMLIRSSMTAKCRMNYGGIILMASSPQITPNPRLIFGYPFAEAIVVMAAGSSLSSSGGHFLTDQVMMLSVSSLTASGNRKLGGNASLVSVAVLGASAS